MSTIGRPRLLDEGKQREICAILSVGGTRKMAADYVGCHVRTIWCTARRDTGFAQRMHRAELAPEITLLKAIQTAAADPKQWRAAAWALERLYPARYGRRKPESLTPDQVVEVLEEFLVELAAELPGKTHRRRLWQRVDTLVAQLKPSQPPSKRKRHGRRNGH